MLAGLSFQGRKADLISRLTAALGTSTIPVAQPAKVEDAPEAAAPANGIATAASAEEFTAEAAAAEAAEERLADAIEQEAAEQAEDDFGEPEHIALEEESPAELDADGLADAVADDDPEAAQAPEDALQEEVGQAAEDAIEAVTEEGDADRKADVKEELQEELEVESSTMLEDEVCLEANSACLWQSMCLCRLLMCAAKTIIGRSCS